MRHQMREEEWEGGKGETRQGFAPPALLLWVILIFSLYCFNTFHHLTFRLDHEKETKEEGLFDASSACVSVCACVCMLCWNTDSQMTDGLGKQLKVLQRYKRL